MDQSRKDRIMSLAWPIIGGMVSQNLLNLVDTFMVGRLGDAALAAVGYGGFSNFMCQALILGISAGVQATAARRKGEGRHEETAGALNAGLLLVLIAGLLLTIILYPLVPLLYPYLNDNPEIMAAGIPYLQVRILATVFVGMNFAFRGYWNAVDLSRLYMSTLLLMHGVNIVVSYILIFGKLGVPAMGVTGAAIGTSVSIVVGTCTYFYLGFKYARANGFLKKIPNRRTLWNMVKLSLPNSIQQLFFSAGFVAMFWIIGKIGKAEVAAANVLINITLVAILPAIAMGLSAATLVGQALGRREPDDAMRWGWDVVKLGMIRIGVLGIPMLLVPNLILAPFLKNPETLMLAEMPLRILGFGLSIDAMGLILMNALLGAGATRQVMIVSIGMQWFVFLPMAFFVGPLWGWGLLGIWVLQGLYRIVQAIIFHFIWRRGRWTSTQI